MVQTVHSIHAMLGETLALLAVIGLVVALFARDPQGGARRATVVFLRLFAIALSLQWVIGLINFIALYRQGTGPGWVHPIVMTVVLALAHIASGRMRRQADVGHGPIVGVTAVVAFIILFGIGRLGVNVF